MSDREVVWTTATPYKVGDIVEIPWAKPRWKVWLDLLLRRKTRGRNIEWRRFRVTSTAAGAMWPEVE